MKTSTSDAAARATMYDDGTAEDNVVKTFYYSATQTKPDGVTANAFRLQSSGNNYWNERDGYLALWASADAVGNNCVGSAYIFVEPTSIYEEPLAKVQTAVSTYPSYVGKPLSHTQEQINTLQASIRSTNPTTISEYYTYAEELEAALATFKASPIQSLEAGKLYRMVCAYEGFEQKQNVRKNIIAATTLSWGTEDKTSAQQYWWAEPQSDGSYYMKSVYTGKYLNFTNGAGTLSETAQKVEFANTQPGVCNIRVNGTGVLHTNGHSSGAGVSGTVIGYGTFGSQGGGSAWTVEEATLDEVRGITESPSLTVPFDGKKYVCVGSKIPTEETLNSLAGISTVASVEEANSILESVYPLSADAFSELTFDANKLYRIVCVSPKKGTGFGDGSQNTLTINSSANKLVCATPSNADFNQLWQFVPGSTEGQYALKNMNSSKYVGPTNSFGSTRVALTESENMFELLAYSVAGQYRFHTAGSTDTNHCLYCENESGKYEMSVWNDGENSPSAWYILPVDDIEVSLNAVGDHTYATTYLPFAVSEVSGAKAYVGAFNEEDKTQVNLTKVSSFAANEGVMLYGETTSDTKATLTIGGTAEKRTDNAFTGTCTEISVAEAYLANYLVMGRNTSGEIGFFKPGLQGTATTFTIKANRAYLDNSSSTTSSVMINFGGVVEGIDEALAPAETATNAPIFDLAGRCVTTAVKGGVYIQNGKKFIVK